MPFENIRWFHVFFVVFLASNVDTLTAARELLKNNISEPQAICNDNSRATFYIGAKTSKKWIVFFESGGFCSSFADCNRRYLSKDSTILMTSNKLPDRITGRDLLSASGSENPAFFRYNHVLVPYCSSDLWLGLKTNPNKPFRFVNDSSVDNFSFRGQTIFRSVFMDLLQLHNLTDAEEIILAGSSAGGIGILNHADWVLKYVVETHRLNASLLSLIDSAWFIDFQGSLQGRVNPKFTSFANISSPACLDYSRGHTCCPSAPCMIARGYYPARVPLLLISSMYDIYMFGEVVKTLEAEGKTANEHSADFISAINMYGGAMNESLSSSEEQSLNVSFFTPACFQHIYFATSSLWDENGIFSPSMEVVVGNAKFRNKVRRKTWETTKISKTSMKDFVSTWVRSRDASIKLIDSCIGAQCNPTCPQQLFFIDPAVNWVEVVKIIIIILSLSITVTCFGLKAVFMLYQYHLSKKQRQYLTDTETEEVQKELPPAQPSEIISIACLALSYSVDVNKKKTKNDRDKLAPETKVVQTDQPEGTSPLMMRNDLDNVFEEEESTSLSSESNGEIDSFPSDNLGFESLMSLTPERTDFTKMKLHSTQNGHSHSQDNPRVKVKEAKTRNGQNQKPILKNVSVYFNPGELVAILGPSGSGKTTLLDLLTGRRETGNSQGAVFINGVPRSLGNVHKWFARKIGYVLQLAVPYYEELTVRQNLFFAAHMRLPKSMSNAQKFERVEQILAEIGLTSLADTVVGGSVGQGLSGGQKRRLCVALQMINLPSVLFLDEPTSGLDASSSLELLNLLNVVAETGRLVILTIHQPRVEIFHLFHKIILMYDGQVAYYGEPTPAPTLFLKAYLQSTTEEFRLREEAPKIDAKNPADTIMDIMNCSEARRAILDYYQRSGEPQAVQEAIKKAQEDARNIFTMQNMNSDKEEINDAGTFNRIFVLEGRTSLSQTLAQICYFPLIFFLFGLVVGTIYFRAQDKDGILLMSAFCVYCCCSPLFLSSVLMAHLNKALNIYHLERADGCGRSYENVIQTYVRIAALCVIPILVRSAMSYSLVMTSYDLKTFILLIIISLVLNQTWIAVYMMVICAHPGFASRICPMVSAIGGFAGGFLVPRPQMPAGYNLLFYINPQFYGYSAITKALLQNLRLKCVYESKLNCISTEGNAVLAGFGFDTVNIYENLAIMLGMTVISLIFSWLFLEIKNMKMKFSKTSSKISRSQMDKILDESIELLNEAGHTANPTRRRSTLGIVTHDDGMHTVKLPDSPISREYQPDPDVVSLMPQTSPVMSRESRWAIVRRRMAERRLSTHLEMQNVQRIVRHSTFIQSKQVQSQMARTRKKTIPLPPRIRHNSDPGANGQKPEPKKKRHQSYHETNDHNPMNLELKMTTWQPTPRPKSVCFPVVEEGDQEMTSRSSSLKSIREHDDAFGSVEEEEDTANIVVDTKF